MRRLAAAVTFVLVATLALVGCGDSSVTSVANDQKITDAQLQQYQAVQPIPFFNWSQMRQVLIDIYQAQNQARQTWAVFLSYTGAPLFSCESVGYPIPADTQLTNPEQITHNSAVGGNYGYGVVGQMEPNGTYSSTSTSGTYVLCVRPDGKLAPVYSEPQVMMFPFEVSVVGGQIVDKNGASNISVDITPPANVPVVAAPSPSPAK
jgi:hypothetical protein